MKKEPYFIRNVVSVTSVEFSWGIGMPLVFESTFLQLFLRSIGASNLLIGLIPTIFTLGLALLPQAASFYTAPLTRKQPAVVIVHIIPAVFVFLIGTAIRLTESGSTLIVLFFVFYALFSAGMGMTVPVWQNYLVKLFSPQRAVTALSVMMIGQNVSKLIVSFVLAKVVEAYAFSREASSIIFIAAGCVLAGSSFFFLIGKENVAATGTKRGNFFRYIADSAREVVRNKNFLFFQLSDIETYATVGVISFYANYAVEYRAVSAALASGGFLAAQYIGGICVNLSLGMIQKIPLKRKILFYKLVSLAGIVLILVFGNSVFLFIASFCFGFARTGRTLLFPPSVKTLSGSDEATHYFAFSPILMLPPSMLIPLLNGAILDAAEKASARVPGGLTGPAVRAGEAGAGAGFWAAHPGFGYKIVFLIMGIIVIASLFLLKKADFSRPSEADGRAGNDISAG